MQDATLPRVIVRAAECLLLSETPFERPILDVGSGDGSFAAALFEEPVDIGIDPWREQMVYSKRFGAYRSLAQAVGDHLPFADGAFATVFSNSTLEHIADPEAVLREMHRVTRPGGLCVITVPSHRFSEYLLGATVLRAVGLQRGANRYARFVNRISRHVHVEPPSTWMRWIEEAGFIVESWRYYYSHRDTMLLDLAHYLSAWSLLTKAVLGRWVLWPGKTRLIPFARLLAPFSRPGDDREGAYLLFRCRKPKGSDLA